MRLGDSFIDSAFQSTPSAWRETPMSNIQFSKQVISIHSLRMEGDRAGNDDSVKFLNISIHSLRMEGDKSLA